MSRARPSLARSSALAALAASLGLGGACGCGYSAGYRAPPSVETIAIPLFSNETFPLRRDVEHELTSALRKEVQARTALRLVGSEQADLVLYGTVRDFREKLVAEGRRDQKIESTVVISVRVVLEDYRNGRRREETVTVREPLSVQLGETLEAARRRAIANLAEKVLEQVEWWEEGA
ncbi:MAG: hypothetical protein HY721_20190 [Planctomycetes bacterium]|nr:hypothetical protein [Planctomycetota bacterium]